MNGLNILIPDMFYMLAAEHPPRENTPALSDDTGSSSSRESSPPATPVSGLSRAPSISFDDDSKHTPTGDGTDIKIVEADADSSPPEDITRPLKRRRLADIRADELRAERVLPPDILSDATKADYDTSFCLEHIRIGDCTSAGDVKPDSDAVHPSLEHVLRPLKRKRLVDMSTDDACAKRAQTSDISSGAANIEDSASFDLGHIPIHDCTKIRVAEPDGVHPISHSYLHAPLKAIARPPKRKRCADTTTDEVRVKRRRLSDSPSNASKLKDEALFGPHLRCMVTSCVSAEVEACYILSPDMSQRLAYKYCVVVEDEHPSGSCIPKDYTITPPVAMACSSYRSLGWHNLSANLHLMTIRVGHVVEPVFSHIKGDSPVEVIPRLPKRKRSPDAEIDEVPAKRMRTSGSARNTSKVEDSVPFGPHPRCMITGCVSAEVEACYILPPDMPQLLVNRKMDYITFNMHTNYNVLRCPAPGNFIFLRRDLRELWETNRLLMIPHPDHLQELEHCSAYKYCIVAEEEHPPDSCTTMNNIITPSVMTAPCSYRSLGWHELNANLRLMIFRAGQKLSKRPLHYQHVLRDLLPHNEVNHAYTIIRWHGTWTAPLTRAIVPDRRLWATGELSACPKNYYRPPRTQYCSPLLDDDTDRFRRQFRPILSGIRRRRSGDTSGNSQDHIRDIQREVNIRQWYLECDHARDEWAMGPPAEPEDAEMLTYRQEQAGNVQPVVQKLWRKRTDPAIANSTNEPDIFPDRSNSRFVEYKKYKRVGSSILIVPANHPPRLSIPQLPMKWWPLWLSILCLCASLDSSGQPPQIPRVVISNRICTPVGGGGRDDFVLDPGVRHIIYEGSAPTHHYSCLHFINLASSQSQTIFVGTILWKQYKADL
ncbi:predicted protein [Postia placenta Mad-698-R]|nr:predicted protein [Postia placenta Mad-698-R]